MTPRQALGLAVFLTLAGCVAVIPQATVAEPTGRPFAPESTTQDKHSALRERILARSRLAARARAAWVDTRTPDQIADAACAGPGGRWVCARRVPKHVYGTGGSSPPSSWSVPLWAIDESNASGCASNSNTCTSASCGSAGMGPCLDPDEIVRRWGTVAPILPQPTVLSFVSTVTHNVWVEPTLTQSGKITLQGVVSLGSPMTINTVTAKNRAAGTPEQINVTGHGAWTPGSLLRDTTAGASFWVDADLGGGTAQITQPYVYPVDISNPTQGTIAPGDSIQLATLPTVTIKRVSSLGLAQDSPEGGCLLTNLLLTAEPGPGGAFPVGVISTTCGITESAFSTTTTWETYEPVTGDGIYVINDYAPSIGDNPTLDGSFDVIGGALNGFNAFLSNSQFLVDGDALVHGGVFLPLGVMQLGCAYFDTSLTGDTPGYSSKTTYVIGAIFFDAAIWGPGGITLNNGAQFILAPGTTATASVLNTGGLKLDGATTGFPWVSASHAWGAAVSITPAAIDSNHGLSNPQTGSSFHF